MHRLLRRQLARCLGPAAADWAPALPGGGGVPDLPGLPELLLSVDEAYAAADDDRLMLERSLDITSGIMLQKNEDLRAARDAAEHAKDRAERADHEKGLLLREIHHRVKNNLQVIVSLLSLQANAKGDEGYREFIAEATGRLQSMAVAHEILYESGDFSRIDFAAYAERIARGATWSSAAGPVLQLDLEPIVLGLDQAMPCGLILNEALTNALKYGRGADGRVRIAMRLAALDGKVIMEVTDSGAGFPPGFEDQGGLGLTLMSSLAAQLMGEIRFENRPGARVSLLIDRV